MNNQADKQDDDNAYLLPSSKIKAVLNPLPKDTNDEAEQGSAKADSSDLAADVIRTKISALYGGEPDAKAELVEAKEPNIPHSKHQQFMLNLSESGKSVAEIQTAWHEYYSALPDKEKHEVWQEFYSAAAIAKKDQKTEEAHSDDILSTSSKQAHPNTHRPMVSIMPGEPTLKGAIKHSAAEKRSVAEIKQQITNRVRTRSKLKPKHHVQSLLFGLSMGAAVLLIMLFGFFNERFIAPFITPSRNVSATPIIIDPNSTAVGPESKVIIPKINVEIPVVYDVGTTEEKEIQASLERGVVHYATSAMPGEQGNNVIVGHSSNNILNKGKYKFAFVLLKRLENGDTFYLTKDGKRYAYKVFEKKIVKPNDISVLGNNSGKPATVTLITCDPPGTSINRLIVVGEQISPDPAGNVASKAAPEVAAQPKEVPGNAPSLWNRFTSWLTS